jgi:hypothetical protein
MDLGPIFLGGLSRCGKTLLRALLASHPNIAIPPKESNMWTYFHGRYGDLGQEQNFERCLNAILHYKDMQSLNPDRKYVCRTFWQGEPTYARLFALFHAHYAEQLGKPRWGIQSVCLEYYANLVLAAYPTAKMIHMIRDPRDRYAVQLVTRRSRGLRKAAIATANWLYSIKVAKRNQKRYPHQYKVVRYETLVSQPTQAIRDICAFLGEDHTPLTLALKDTFRYKGEEISTAFIGCFPQVMTKREVAFMQTCAKRDMLAYGYKPEPMYLSLSDTLPFYLVDQPLNLAHMLGWRIWKALQLRFPTKMGHTLPPHLICP